MRRWGPHSGTACAKTEDVRAIAAAGGLLLLLCECVSPVDFRIHSRTGARIVRNTRRDGDGMVLVVASWAGWMLDEIRRRSEEWLW